MTVSSERLAVSSRDRRKLVVRRIVVCLLLTGFLVSVAEAQQPKKGYAVGYLSALDPARESNRAEAIRQALHELAT